MAAIKQIKVGVISVSDMAWGMQNGRPNRANGDPDKNPRITAAKRQDSQNSTNK